jgi:hypothetical protein
VDSGATVRYHNSPVFAARGRALSALWAHLARNSLPKVNGPVMFGGCSEELFDRIIAINLKGV